MKRSDAMRVIGYPSRHEHIGPEMWAELVDRLRAAYAGEGACRPKATDDGEVAPPAGR